VILEGGCRVSAIREGQPIEAGTLRIWQEVGRDSGARAISLRTLEFSKGSSPKVPNPGCDDVVYVLEGHGSVTLNDRVYDLEPEMGIYIRPYQVFSVWNPNAEPIVLISSRCPEPEGGAEVIDSGPSRSNESSSAAGGIPEVAIRSTLEGAGGSIADSPPTLPATASSNSNPAPVVRLSDRKAVPTADRWYRVLVDEQVGCTEVTQFIGSIPPGRAPDHFHLYEEVLLILRGEGRMWAGATNTPIEAGSGIYLPNRQIHCVENTGTDELRLLGVFYPAGSPAVRYDAETAT